MIYLYGLAEASPDDMRAALYGFSGLQAPLEVTQFNDWVLVHSQQDDAEILPKRRLMLAHTRVLEQMLGVGTVLPARFGLVAASLAQTETLITARAPVIGEEFARIRGCVEVGVRIRYPRQAALDATLEENADLRAARDALRHKGPEAHFAIAEFGGKMADLLDRRRSHAQKTLLGILAPLAHNHVLRAPEDDTEVLRAEFLIKASEQDSFESAVEAATQDLTFAPGEEPKIQFIGPVPVYNFVRLSLSADLDEAAA